MKKSLFIGISFITFLFLVVPVYAVTSTPSATIKPTKASDTQSSVADQINQLKDRIASRVAQLKLVERRGVIGIVTQVSDTQLTMTDLQNNTRIIDVDELTKFASPSAKGSFGISDITKGEEIGVLGLYNKQSRKILARFIDVLVTPVIVNGAVVALDENEYVITIVTEAKKQYTVDVETTTKTNTYTQEAGLTKAGFSKIKIGERIRVSGYPSTKDNTNISATRILLFPELPINPQIVLPSGVQAIEKTIAVPTIAATTSATKKTTQ